MQEFDIDGITVKYPFIPYEVQKKYMQSVIESLNKGENALLESPTGTGKTLCLLCSTLGWIEHRKEQLTYTDESIPNSNVKQNAKINNVPLVIYASRTHSQLLQAMKELKRSAYGYMKAGVVASRDQLCIHPELKMENNSNKILKCKKLRSEDGCDYYKKVDNALKQPELSENPVLDIEDLIRHGKNFECCPYYVAKHLATNADILFMPYNYLLDPKIREIYQSNLRNAIVILDEAHNVPKVCEDSACTRITSTEIFIALRDIKFIRKSLPNKLLKEKQIGTGQVERLRDKLFKLSNEILNIKIESENSKEPGGYIFKLFGKAGINEDTIDILQRLLSCLVEYSKGFKQSPKGIGLQALLDFLQIAYSSSAPDLRERVNRAYKVYIQYEPKKREKVNEAKRKRGRNSKTKMEGEEDAENRKIINFWCFSAEFGMNYLQRQNIHCVILTSGTLTPLDSMINELQIPIPIELSNKHVINNQQIFGSIIMHGPDNKMLNSTYKNRDTREYMLSLGKTILELSKVIPEGLLVFFTAYSVMDNCIEFWETEGIYDAINNEKKIFIEPRKKNELKKTMKDYYLKINEGNSKGAIFMAVLRAKVSEGLDFADMYGRGVIITGLPFGPTVDPKIILKRKYLNENRTTENRMLSADEWYTLDAVRAVNQAIGRVIRHRNDYGAILLCDVRFMGNQKNISSWIKHQLRTKQLDTVIADLGTFYEHARQSLPEPRRITPQIDSFDDEEDQTVTYARSDSSDYFMSSESDNDDEEDSKSRSTSPIPSTSAAGQKNNGSQVTIHKKKLRLSDQNGSDEYNSEVVNEPVKAHPIPKNMESPLGIDIYQQLIKIWYKYDADGDYEIYRDSLFSIFDDEKWIYILKGCLLFTKLEHQAILDKDIAAFLQGL